jgi:hypothetical protein
VALVFLAVDRMDRRTLALAAGLVDRVLCFVFLHRSDRPWLSESQKDLGRYSGALGASDA